MRQRERPRPRPRHLPRRPQAGPQLELADIQGNLLRGYTHPVGAYLFAGVDDAAGGRAWLAGLVGEVTTAEPWSREPSSTLNLSFTFAGLRALGVADELLATFPAPFREGMAARARELGDPGASAPEHWEAGLGTGDAHLLVTAYAVDDEVLEERLAALREGLEDTGGAVRLVHEQRAAQLPGGRDHFGFNDGIAQPAIMGSGVVPRPGDGRLDGDGWQPLKAGEFVLGYEDEDGGLPVAPAAPFDRNATFVVYRKYHMDPAAFRRFVDDAGRGYPGGPEKVAAKIVGRWRDGTPLCASPDGPDPAVAGDPRRINDFRFADDQEGMRCPLGSHIRRVNPRDTEGFFDGKLSDRHRIIRRGRSYGPPLDAGASEDDGEDRGLIFKCYNADLERQFETIQALWVDDGDPFGVGADKDPLIGGDGGGKMTIQGHPPLVLGPRPAFTTLRGGEYLFRPGMRALRWLAEPAA